MRVLHLNAGNETGGGMYHILRLFQGLPVTCVLGVFEKKELFRRADLAQLKPIHFAGRFRLNPGLITRLARFIKTEKITHVHTHGPRASVYMNVLRHFVRVEWVVTVHSDPFFDFRNQGVKGFIFEKLHLQALKNAEKVITVCDAFQPDLMRAGIKASKMTTIQNGINFSREIPDKCQKTLRASFNFAPDDFLIVKVARLETVKGHEIAIRAFAELAQGREIHLLFVGGGSLQTKLEWLVAELALTDKIHFYGERNDVDTFYQIANVTLLCSLSESFPYVLLEAARAKVPVIATDVGDIKYLIKYPEFGWTIPPNDVGGLMTALEAAIVDENLQKRGENLFLYASVEFSLAKCAREVYNVYARVY